MELHHLIHLAAKKFLEMLTHMVLVGDANLIIREVVRLV